MGLNLTNQYISSSFKNLLQISGSDQVTDGTGSLVTDLDINVSNAVSSSFATTASYAENANVDSGSWDGQFSGSAGITGSLTVSGENPFGLPPIVIQGVDGFDSGYIRNGIYKGLSGDTQMGINSNEINLNITGSPISELEVVINGGSRFKVRETGAQVNVPLFVNGDVNIEGEPGNQYALRVNPESGSLSAVQANVRGTGENGYPIAYQALYLDENNDYVAGLAMQFDATDTGSIKPTWYMDSNGNGARIVSEDAMDITILNGDPLTINTPVILAQNATGSLFGTASHAIYAETAGNVTNAIYAQNTITTGKNISGVEIQKGTPLYFTGSGTGGNLVGVYPADAGNPDRMPAGGIAGETFAIEAEGVVLLDGYIGGVGTSDFASGDKVYVGVGGGYTKTPPTGSNNLIQFLGNIEKSHPSNGSGVINMMGESRFLPNIQQGYVWIGNQDGVPVAVPTGSITTEWDGTYDGHAFINGALDVTQQSGSNLAPLTLKSGYFTGSQVIFDFFDSDVIDQASVAFLAENSRFQSTGDMFFNSSLGDGNKSITFESQNINFQATGSDQVGFVNIDAKNDIRLTAEGQVRLESQGNLTEVFGNTAIQEGAFIVNNQNTDPAYIARFGGKDTGGNFEYILDLANDGGGGFGIANATVNGTLQVNQNANFLEGAYINGQPTGEPGIGLIVSDGQGPPRLEVPNLDLAGILGHNVGLYGKVKVLDSAGPPGGAPASLEVKGDTQITGSLGVAGQDIRFDSNKFTVSDQTGLDFVSEANVTFESKANDIQFLGDSDFSGSVEINGNLTVTEGITGSLQGNASTATSASHALLADNLTPGNKNIDIGTGTFTGRRLDVTQRIRVRDGFGVYKNGVYSNNITLEKDNTDYYGIRFSNESEAANAPLSSSIDIMTPAFPGADFGIANAQIVFQRGDVYTDGTITMMNPVQFNETIQVSGSVTAPNFIGNLTGNADTATSSSHAELADNLVPGDLSHTGVFQQTVEMPPVFNEKDFFTVTGTDAGIYHVGLQDYTPFGVQFVHQGYLSEIFDSNGFNYGTAMGNSLTGVGFFMITSGSGDQVGLLTEQVEGQEKTTTDLSGHELTLRGLESTEITGPNIELAATNNVVMEADNTVSIGGGGGASIYGGGLNINSSYVGINNAGIQQTNSGVSNNFKGSTTFEGDVTFEGGGNFGQVNINTGDIVSSTGSIDLLAAQQHWVNQIPGETHIEITNAGSGRKTDILLFQNATGSLWTFADNINWIGGSAPSIPVSNYRQDLIRVNSFYGGDVRAEYIGTY